MKTMIERQHRRDETRDELADQRADQPRGLGEADADHDHEDDRDRGEVAEVGDERREEEADRRLRSAGSGPSAVSSRSV